MAAVLSTSALLAWATPPAQDGPAELYEAARVDGATPARVFRKITYPLLQPIFLVLLVVTVGYVRSSVRQGALT